MLVFDQIADATAKNKTQRSAVIKALSQYQDLVLTSDRTDPEPLVERATYKITTDFAFFVLSGPRPTSHEAACLRLTLAHYATKGTVTVVTAGRWGLESQLPKIAGQLGLVHVEVAAVWAQLNADGTTSRPAAPSKTRNQTLSTILSEYKGRGGKAAVIVCGVEAPKDQIAPVLAKAGALVTRPAAPKSAVPVKAAVQTAAPKVSMEA